MKILRLILGIITTMLVLTFIVEGTEFLIVKIVSGQSMEYLSNNQSEYFKIRNQTWFLVLKLVYTFFGAYPAGWLGYKITKHLQTAFFITIIMLQTLVFLYAMFFSEFKSTLKIYYWFLLLIVVLCGIFFSKNYFKNKIA
ncbi:hypothetical protein N7U66_03510 [Lacinutrix neustonica]|uniref:Uncharacterized protein n=1 Tax=Lacinutrix neustonica TaxID=2980107 RepID=A0A9E8SE40_9FLAO|nr:hypothetical protein [Lacinutrix neustonica]WAC02751.1 hypothetical protein N7U66_03510 [Lacinutrix neustonica]